MTITVRIFRPDKTAMQSGHARTGQWRLEALPESRKSPDSLMGWVSSQDTLGQIQLAFDTKEEAIAHAVSQGWSYTVMPAHDRRLKPKSYADNFSYYRMR